MEIQEYNEEVKEIDNHNFIIKTLTQTTPDITLKPFVITSNNWNAQSQNWELLRYFSGFASRATEINSNIIASLPLRLFLQKPKGKNPKNIKTKKLTPKHTVQFKSLISDTDNEIVEVIDHPAIQALRKANKYQTAFEIWKIGMSFYHMTGNFYLRIIKDKVGNWIGCQVMPSQFCRAQYDAESGEVIGYRIGRSGEQFLPFDEVICIKDTNLGGYGTFMGSIDQSGMLFGVGKAEKCWNTLVENGLMDAFDQKWLRQYGAPNFAIEYPKEVKISKEIRDSLKDELRNLYANPDNISLPIVLDSGATTKEIGNLTASRGQISSGNNNSRVMIIESIASVWGIPAEWLSRSTNSPGNVYETAKLSHLENTIVPLATQISESLNVALERDYPQQGLFFSFDATPNNPEKAKEHYLNLYNAGIVSLNEVRALEGLEPMSETTSNNEIIPTKRKRKNGN